MKKNRIVLASVAIGAAAAAFVYDRSTGNAVSGTDVNNPELVARGGAIYAQQCAACHGGNLQGQTPDWRSRLPDGSIPAPPHDATGHTWHHPDSQLFDVTKYGRYKASGGRMSSNMPGFEDKLSDGDIWAVLSYIKSTWPAQVRTRNDAINRQADARR